MPEIPEAFPVIEIPEVEFTQIAPLFSNLPEAKESMDIQPMEAFDQGWGTILYRTTLQEPVENGTTMKITEVHDWAQVLPMVNCWLVWTVVVVNLSCNCRL